MSELNNVNPLRVGLLGLGTVGQALVGLTRSQAHRGVVEIVAASVRDPAKPRPGTDGIALVTAPMAVANDPSLPIIVELMGGADAPLPYVLAALNRGATIVTANKAMLAAHAGELLSAAEKGGGDLLFEGAVAGGIPIVRLLREALTSDPMTALYGIINGTSNFILSEMTQSGREFGDVLREAQAKGYAEADPTLDVGGGDARQKLALLCALAFGELPIEAAIPCRGIDGITPGDIDYARDKGYRIKLVGFSGMTATLKVTRTEILPYPVRLPVTVSGTAWAGEDYEFVGGRAEFVFAAGSREGTLGLRILDLTISRTLELRLPGATQAPGVIAEQTFDQRRVTNVTVHERHGIQPGQIGAVAGIGEGIEHDDGIAGVVLLPIMTLAG
jgi:homoserine dehydrogenase